MAWGSTRGAVAEAARRLRSEGMSVGHLHFSQVWPMVAEGVLPYLERATEVICVEGNATGQFARLVRRETGFQAHRLVLRYDGLPITPRYVLDGLKQRQPATKGAVANP
jgi:2-oxoglutarate ferredoxin oxidoreductase subunit alpha